MVRFPEFAALEVALRGGLALPVARGEGSEAVLFRLRRLRGLQDLPSADHLLTGPVLARLAVDQPLYHRVADLLEMPPDLRRSGYEREMRADRLLADVTGPVAPLATGHLWAPPSFPYLRPSEGTYRILGEPRRVVVLGDIMGIRTLELAVQGHHVTHIDLSPTYLQLARNSVERRREQRLGSGEVMGEFNIDFVLGNWFDRDLVRTGDYVEAFNPLAVYDVPYRAPGGAMYGERKRDLSHFLYQAVLPHLAPDARGGIFIISEVPEIIEDLALIVREDPQLQLCEEVHSQTFPAIVGGQGQVMRANPRRHFPGAPQSWIVFTRRPV